MNRPRQKVNAPASKISRDNHAPIAHRCGHCRRFPARRRTRIENPFASCRTDKFRDELRGFVLDEEETFACERRRQRVAVADRQSMRRKPRRCGIDIE